MVQLQQAHETGAWDACLTRFTRPKLLIIDGFGYLPMPPQTAHLLFQLIAARYETGSILLTSNQGIADWDRVLGDDVSDKVGRFRHPRSAVTSLPGDHAPRRQLPTAHEASCRTRRQSRMENDEEDRDIMNQQLASTGKKH